MADAIADAIADAVIQQANQHSRRLRELLHAPDILIMPGAYDTLSALFFEHLGFPAIQGSSGGIAAVYGLRDGEILLRSVAVEVYRRMVEVVTTPVNADGEKGYGGPEETAETVRQLAAAGAAGMNLEDSDYHTPGEPIRLIPVEMQLEKLRSVMETKRRLGSEFFLNARVDAYLTRGDPAAMLDEAIRRGNAYAESGADCIFYIGVRETETIQTLVREVHAPLSILANPSTPSVRELEDLGVARVSYGVAFTRAALTGVKQLAEVLLAKGDPAPFLNQIMSGPEMNQFLRERFWA